MRKIPDKDKNLPEGKALKEAQDKFLEASQALLVANRTSRAEGYASTEELQKAASALQDAELRMKAAELEFDRISAGPEPVPLTDAVFSKVKQSFPEGQQAEVKRLLETECADNLPFREIGTPQGLERIRLAVLKVADGNESELRKQVEAAKRDWRDVINAAEYPEAAKLGLVEYKKLDESARKRIDERDRQQYLAWLNNGQASTQSHGIWNKVWPWRRAR